MTWLFIKACPECKSMNTELIDAEDETFKCLDCGYKNCRVCKRPNKTEGDLCQECTNIGTGLRRRFMI